MQIELNPSQLSRLEELAKKGGKRVEVLAAEILTDVLASTNASSASGGSSLNADEAAVVRKQRQAHERFLQEMDALPLEAPDDGFSGTDHDRALYGSKS